MFFSLALVLSSLSITYNSNNIPINPVSIPSTGIYATAVIDDNTNTLCVELFRYNKISTNGYLRMYAEKTEGEYTYKPIISQTDFSYTQTDLEDVVNFGFGYYGGNNNLSVSYTISVNGDSYHYGSYSQIYLDNYYNGATYEDNSITVNSVKVYFSALDESTYSAITDIIDEGTSAYDNGYNQGFQNGYASGFADGTADLNQKLTIAESQGYVAGYNQGKLDSPADYGFMSLFFTVADTPVMMFRRLFDFSIFGTSILTVVLSLFTMLFVIHLVKKVLK